MAAGQEKMLTELSAMLHAWPVYTFMVTTPVSRYFDSTTRISVNTTQCFIDYNN